MTDPEHQTESLSPGPHDARIHADELTIDWSDLVRGLGYSAAPDGGRTIGRPQRPIPPHMREIVETLLGEGRDLLDPRWVWVASPATLDAAADELLCTEPRQTTLSVGRLVRTQLKGSLAVAAFVVTIGSALERRAREMMADGQPLEGYVLDTVGSLAVEAVADLLELHVADAVAGRGWQSTNRFSPGYCTWTTAGQHALFSMFPKQPAGVTLNESSLMSPIKSVSGVIGLGPEVKHRPYPCELCAMTSCHQRLTEARP